MSSVTGPGSYLPEAQSTEGHNRSSVAHENPDWGPCMLICTWSMHADMYMHTSWGPSYRQMAHGVGNQRMVEERLFTKMKGVILNWRQFCPLGNISNVYRHFWSHFSHPLGKVLLSSREQRPVWNIQQCTRQAPTARTYSAPNASRTETEKPCYRMR